MRADAARVSPVSATVSWTGTPAIDIAGAVVDQLQAYDVPVRWVPGCTRESPDLYSYRRDPQTGRFAGVVRLLPERGEA
jgi:copper oxidase (laccase) domain-containing protein